LPARDLYGWNRHWNSLVTPNAKYQCMAQSPKSARGVAIAG
jgi:hypothetical protein